MIESGFTSAVNDLVRQLAPEVRIWKISDRFTRGIPDCRYSGPGGSLFIEFKWRKSLPRTAITPALRLNQQLWLEAEHQFNTRVAVVIGTPKQCLVFPGLEWKIPRNAEHAITRKEVAEWIVSQVCIKSSSINPLL